MRNNNNLSHSIQVERERLWQKDFSLRRVFELYHKKLDEIKELNVANSEHAEFRRDCSNSLSSKIKSYFPLFVGGVDFICAYLILSSFVDHLIFLPLWLSVLLICVLILYLEITFGLFLSEQVVQRDATLEIDSAPSFWQQNDRMKYIIFHALGCIFIFIVPMMSLVEFFEQQSANEFAVNLGSMTTEEQTLANRALMIKYFGLGLMSLISHSYVVFFTKKIAQAFSLTRFNVKMNQLEADLEKLKSRKLKHISSVMSSVVVLEGAYARQGLLNGGETNDILEGMSEFLRRIVREVKLGNSDNTYDTNE